MKILFLAGGSPATVFALVPLATAARNAGHEVMLGVTGETVWAATGVGLPALAVTELTLRDFIYKDRHGEPSVFPADPVAQDRFTGAWSARMGEAGLPVLRELAKVWRPDAVVGGTMAYAAPLLAAELGVPHVRQTWDGNEFAEVDRGAAEELGVPELPAPDLFVDITPPSLRFPGAPAAQPMRWRPGNVQRPLEPWMYTPGPRPRVVVTAGSRISGGDRAEAGDYRRYGYEFLLGLAKELSGLDAELVVAAPDDLTAALRAELGDVHAGWVPLDVVAPTCAAIVHSCGGITTMTAVSAGVPQLVLPLAPAFQAPARRLVDRGVALMPGEEGRAAACGTLIGDPAFRAAAADLAGEVSELPPPAEVLAVVESLL
ncbi:glycosyltransferase [Actinomadura terrae]|uniref:glycosyltransferase n=1 Tax=Actinomadura terrae TaxID=604353 RepID=UPI001FA6EDDA|nr:glycosyltransferase [Actinomadura terrae]